MFRKRKPVKNAWNLLFLILLSGLAEAKTFEHVQKLPVKGTVAVRSESEEGVPGAGEVWSDSVQYAAQSVDYRFDEDTILFLGDAKIRYGKMTLTAEKITLRIQDDMIFAEGIPDSAGKPIGTPVFREGTEEIRGLRMTYNIKTKTGAVVSGKTAFEKGFYRGECIRQMGKDVLGVSRGIYTTCDRENPHYHFYSRRMKVLVNDKVIAKPLIFYVADVPVFYLPFAVLPIKKGRHSGILTPRYGSSSYDGRFIRNVGYYMAPSDYWDATLKASFFEETGWLLESDFRYALRYRFRGSVAGSYKDEWRSGERIKRRWNLRLSHNQTLDPTLSFRGSANFASDKTYMKDTGLHPIDRMNRTMRSDLFLNKRWPKSGNSLSASISHSKFLDTSESTLYLPRIGFRRARKAIFSPDESTEEAARWYHTLYYSFRTNALHTQRKRKNSLTGALEDKNSMDLKGDLNLSTSQKTRWFNLSPSLGWSERWQRTEDGEYIRTDALNTSVGLNTKLYGLFLPRIGALKAIRHVVEPRASFRMQHRRITQGGTYGFGGETDPIKPRRSLNLSLNNLLQIKTQKGKKERKLTLATLNVSTSYDFEKETRPFSDLRTSLSIKPVRRFDVRFSALHSLYDQDDTFDPLRPDLKNMSVTSSLRFSGGGSGKTSETTGLRSSTDPFLHRASDSEERPLIPSLDTKEDGERTPASGPWQFQFSHYYGLYKMATSSRKTSWIKGSLRFNPTTHWRVSYAFNYDLEGKEMTAHDVSIYRDLHCWEAQFQWTPSGYREGYYFLLNIKELPDIKIEKKRGRGGFSFR